ncbi:MAG: DEAD/DEAH box helicase family protein, partial [Myxococcales bacterium]|nr:DEAD/DEAH box helicase family protein [Myxococcales bacterium]
ITPTDHVAGNALAFAIRDRYPVSTGHTLIMPTRHVATWFDATTDEQAAMMALAAEVKADLDARCAPDGYNLGLNVGEAAGQTVMHLHLHVIPRYRHDVDDPRGGVRYVIPERGNYLRPGFCPAPFDRPRGLATGGRADPFAAHLAPLFAAADRIDVLTAFAQTSGVTWLRGWLLSAMDRGARIRVLIGDYLEVTAPDALAALLDLSQSTLDAPQLELRVAEAEALKRQGIGTTFHPKAWIFGAGPRTTAFVGSSNLSKPALTDGIEWNLRVDSAADGARTTAITAAFDALWQRARPVDDDWLDDYRRRIADRGSPPIPFDLDDDAADAVPEPRDVQIEALAALAADRAEGRRRALCVLATGLGKTWLAAFDVRAFRDETGRRPRVLFLAHRFELLRQAATTFRRLFPDGHFVIFAGAHDQLDGDVVFAMVQKLARPEHLARVAPDAFDYVIVDEVHHADATTWRRIIDHLAPRFLLGLTATPERADAGDIFGLFDDHIAFRADIGLGIGLKHLVPFHYFGLTDPTDYAPIPWRNHRFDPARLAAAVQTQARMARLWAAWQAHPAQRTLVFCCSIEHAHFVCDWLVAQGLRAVAVHSQPGSHDRADALLGLKEGRFDALCAVDLFNEGIDVPTLDRVVMLRPTESSVIFLQQLGRGLRRAEGKAALTVLDFVGNHHVFLERLRTLLNLTPRGTTGVRAFLGGAAPELPEGCTVNMDLAAIDLLRELMPSSASALAVMAYRDLRAARGVRPTAGELYRNGHNPSRMAGHRAWFDFVAAEEGATWDADERAAYEAGHEWLATVGATQMTRCYKMVVLEVLAEADAFVEGMPVPELARRCHDYLRRAPELAADMEGLQTLPDPDDADAFLAYWRRNPITAWTNPSHARVWFQVVDDRFVPALPLPDDASARDALIRMTGELVGWRLARYRRQALDARAAPFECAVVSGPALALPDRARHPALPRGGVGVTLPEGAR